MAQFINKMTIMTLNTFISSTLHQFYLRVEHFFKAQLSSENENYSFYPSDKLDKSSFQ